MASVRGLLNIQSLNESTHEKFGFIKQKEVRRLIDRPEFMAGANF
jgi:hypothetical protein